jgi:CheY-like chemotaxis protein
MAANLSPKKHILIVSGEPRILAEIKTELIMFFNISIAATSELALSALEMNKVAAIVICIDENRDKAFSIFHGIFNAVRSRNIPIIFLAEKGNDDDETTAFALGAVDYSTRRRGTVNALSNRIQLRINASEYEKRVMVGEAEPNSFDDVAPETVLVNKTVLVVEDVELNREIVAAMLSLIDGLTVDLACDGREAVEKFKENPELYALILMDVQMPVMDGLEATKTIRNLDCRRARDIPVIALTGTTEEEEIEKCLKAGMNDFLEKPMSYDRFLVLAAEHCT